MKKNRVLVLTIAVIDSLQKIEDEREMYKTIDGIWPDYPSKDDFFFNEDE